MLQTVKRETRIIKVFQMMVTLDRERQVAGKKRSYG